MLLDGSPFHRLERCQSQRRVLCRPPRQPGVLEMLTILNSTKLKACRRWSGLGGLWFALSIAADGLQAQARLIGPSQSTVFVRAVGPVSPIAEALPRNTTSSTYAVEGLIVGAAVGGTA